MIFESFLPIFFLKSFQYYLRHQKVLKRNTIHLNKASQMKVSFEPVWKIFWDSSSLSFNCEIGLLKWNPIWFIYTFVYHSLSISWIFIRWKEIKLWKSETLLLCWISINMLMILMIGDLTSRICIPLKLLVFFFSIFIKWTESGSSTVLMCHYEEEIWRLWLSFLQ